MYHSTEGGHAMFIDRTEITKLTAKLQEAGLPFETCEKAYQMGDHYEVCLPSVSAWRRKEGASVDINCLTEGHTKGLLEFWDGKSDPVGHLTADAALNLIKERMR